MHGWKKGVLLGLFSSLLWEPHAVEAAIGKTIDPMTVVDTGMQTAATLEATWDVTPQTGSYGNQVLTSNSHPPIDLLQLLAKKSASQATVRVTDAGVSSERTALQEQKQIEQEKEATAEAAWQAAHAPVLASRGDVTMTGTGTQPVTATTANDAPQPPQAKTAQNGGAVSNDVPTLMRSAGVSSTQGSRAVTVALRYLGVPYRYGGTTPSGFDCSGFVQYVMKQVGVDIPRTTYQQINAGTPVAKANLRPGDLIFFSCNGQATSHSGMYVGNGKFVHADLDRGIAIADLNSSYWSSVYEAAVRVQ